MIDLSANMGARRLPREGHPPGSSCCSMRISRLRPSHIMRFSTVCRMRHDRRRFYRRRKVTDLSQRLTPFLSGQRAVKKEILEAITDLKSSGFGMEVSLSRFAKQENLRVFYIPLRRISQIMKEEKRGLVRGFAARMKMYWEIVLLLLGVKLPPH